MQNENAKDILYYSFLGTVPYSEALDLQKKLHSRRVNGETPDIFLFLEHPAVVTSGIRGKDENLLVSRDVLKARGFDYFEIERGGDLTIHTPGQLVGYPILDIRKKGPKKTVTALEDACIAILERYGIEARADGGVRTGVWVGNEKLMAIGLAIQMGVSFHGIALNCSNDVSLFDIIVPCGIRDGGVNSVSGILGRRIGPEEVAGEFVKEFALRVGYKDVKYFDRITEFTGKG